MCLPKCLFDHYLVSIWPWPLTFRPQNLTSSSSSRTSPKLQIWWNSHGRCVGYRFRPSSHTWTHGVTDSQRTEWLRLLIAGESIKANRDQRASYGAASGAAGVHGWPHELHVFIEHSPCQHLLFHIHLALPTSHKYTISCHIHLLHSTVSVSHRHKAGFWHAAFNSGNLKKHIGQKFTKLLNIINFNNTS